MRCWVAALPDILRWAVNQSIQQKATCGNTLQQCNNATTFVSTCMVLLDATRNPFALRFNWSDPSSERLEDMLDVAWSCPYWNVPITFHFLLGISKTSLAIPFPCRLVNKSPRLAVRLLGGGPPDILRWAVNQSIQHVQTTRSIRIRQLLVRACPFRHARSNMIEQRYKPSKIL